MDEHNHCWSHRTTCEGSYCRTCWGIREKVRKERLAAAKEKMTKVLAKLTADEKRFLGLHKASIRNLVYAEMRRYEYTEVYKPPEKPVELVERILE
jgi:hypothetical protein